jgi:hypothetical protein
MYDQGLATRLDEIFFEDNAGGMFDIEVTRMFGGYGFLVNGNMCVGIWNDMLVIRIGIDGWDMIKDDAHIRPMDLTGKVMRGWAMVEPPGLSEDTALRQYVDMAIFFCAGLTPKSKNPKA